MTAYMLSFIIMIVTIDTNVILAALLRKKGASHQILRLIIEEKLKMAVTTAILLEYDSVFKRKKLLEKLELTANDIEDILDLLVLIADKYSIYFRMRPNLFDENDNLFIECAFTSNSRYLITSNIKDFKRAELISYPFKVVTPAEFYRLWRPHHE